MAVAAQSVSDICRAAKAVREIVVLSGPVGELLDGVEGEGQVRS